MNDAGKRHREDGPAYIRYSKDGEVEHETFYVDSELHCVDGPADIWYSVDGQVEREWFYLEGVCFTSEEFLFKMYIDKLSDPVLRVQAVQIAEANGWKVTVEQLGKAVGLTLEEKPPG